MSEADAIAVTDTPRTRSTLATDLRTLGVRPGSVLLVHSSLRSLGWVAGGPVAVVQALLDVLTADGTLVVPTHTSDNSDPAGWGNPPVPEYWWPIIRDHMPGFDPAVTPSRGMGGVAEVVRTWPGARRSSHPHVSFAAFGARAQEIVGGHALDQMLGEASPLARVYDLDGDILLLGVGHGSNTSLHLAEYRVPRPRRGRHAAAVLASTGRAWVEWEDVDLDESDFGRVGADLEQARPAIGAVVIGPVGSAECRLMRQQPVVDFAVEWMTMHRGTVESADTTAG